MSRPSLQWPSTAQLYRPVARLSSNKRLLWHCYWQPVGGTERQACSTVQLFNLLVPICVQWYWRIKMATFDRRLQFIIVSSSVCLFLSSQGAWTVAINCIYGVWKLGTRLFKQAISFIKLAEPNKTASLYQCLVILTVYISYIWIRLGRVVCSVETPIWPWGGISRSPSLICCTARDSERPVIALTGLVLFTSTLKMEAQLSDETLLTPYEATRCQNPEDGLNSHHRENVNAGSYKTSSLELCY
jgi:hypothetical protein